MAPGDGAFLRVGQLIVEAMVAGLALFLVVAVAVRSASGGFNMSFADEPLVVVALALAGGNLLTSVVLGRLFLQQLRQAYSGQPVGEDDLGDLAAQYNKRLLIMAALLEGAGLFAGVAALITGSLLALALQGLMVLGLLLSLPSRGKFERFVSAATGQTWP